MRILDKCYVSPVGTIKETHAELVIEIPIKDRSDLDKFITELKSCHHNIPTVFQKGDTYFIFCIKCKKMLISFSAEKNKYKVGTFGNAEAEEYFKANMIPLTMLNQKKNVLVQRLF